MTRSEAKMPQPSALRDTSWLSIGAIVLIVMMLGAVAADIAGKVGAMVVTQGNWTDILNAFLLALLVNTPTLIIIGVLGDFAGLFSRTGEGEVFSPRNFKSLRSAGGGLIWAAVASALIVPTVLSWTSGDGRGFIWQGNDLALGTGAMGLAILGLSHVFAEGLRLKADSDQII
ncbi:MAG: DUF2975 domain-containing protein [Hyphomonas sp.]|nr:DUF2975 domain-containing protein [Hyphomonas sp.]MDP3458309.1 DUF2975 domain-containing protein [Hyphomonas sp.]